MPKPQRNSDISNKFALFCWLLELSHDPIIISLISLAVAVFTIASLIHQRFVDCRDSHKSSAPKLVVGGEGGRVRPILAKLGFRRRLVKLSFPIL